MRAPLAVLNELSLPAPTRPLSDHELEGRFSDFVEMIRAARTIRRDLALVSHAAVTRLAVTSDGRTLGAVFGSSGGRLREQWRYFQLVRNHAPFAVAPGLALLDHGEEFRYDGAIADGLGLAASNGQVAVSFGGAGFDSDRVAIVRLWLVEKGDEVAEREEVMDAVHAASVAHVRTHESFIRELALPRPFSGADVWEDRAGLFPHLRFLARVESQLQGLPAGSDALRQVAMRLEELEAASAAWDPAAAAAPAWRSLVSPESEQRKKLCWFRDEDGECRCFDLHARFTPGAGRIHFRLDASATPAGLVIAHVGRKLGA